MNITRIHVGNHPENFSYEKKNVIKEKKISDTVYKVLSSEADFFKHFCKIVPSQPVKTMKCIFSCAQVSYQIAAWVNGNEDLSIFKTKKIKKIREKIEANRDELSFFLISISIVKVMLIFNYFINLFPTSVQPHLILKLKYPPLIFVLRMFKFMDDMQNDKKKEPKWHFVLFNGAELVKICVKCASDYMSSSRLAVLGLIAFGISLCKDEEEDAS